eukprot:CAMPEP_0195281098 /NCGR_PEP_ID=MMETSP0707-20130614/549_1 /TAXON_ID=33640 /ORGANISM="Asterionellopsis glacialis, Strain CCMP134" /LENGTH=748 /DNA_ID=CAMNT_0040339943 /DNA_START=78 /DNA_END=2324 /DNA_ORIENTATION=-
MRLSLTNFLLPSSLLLGRSQADKLDDAIANALFRESDCDDVAQNTQFDPVYSSTKSVSKWHKFNDQFEDDVFDMDIVHTDDNANRTWSMRIGKGGQITSFIGAFGEAVANQAVQKAPFNDLVTQIVAVNNEKNTEEHPYFIHGSGPYQKDQWFLDLGSESSTGRPFYNPKLARECSGNTCSYVNWGQQAHVKTPHRSDVLYYQKYKDCGNGVIEYDQIIHHYGNNSADKLTYMNTPWTGVRASTFKDMAVANTEGYLQLKTDTINGWGDGGVRNLDTTGGFTTFTEDYPKTQTRFRPFCFDGANKKVACSAAGAQDPVMKSQWDNPAKWLQSHSNTWGFPVFQIILFNYIPKIEAGCTGHTFHECSFPHGFIMRNKRNNFEFVVDRVIHWAWNGRAMYFGSPDSAHLASRINSHTQRGDVWEMFTTEGKPLEDNLALTMVHGKNPEYQSNGSPKSRMRYGYATNPARDATVWTTNYMGSINMGQTYYNRKYMVVGNYNDAENQAQPLITKAVEDIDNMNELPSGETITLHYSETQFSATVGDTTSCGVTGLVQTCQGSTVPKTGSKPLYYIVLDDNEGTSKVTHDPYHFDQTQPQYIPLRPYFCSSDKTIRPIYKLLGYFPTDSCALDQQTYMPELCPDGKCSKYSGLPGWNTGEWIAESPLSDPLAWKECAQRCAENIDCEFWTLRLTGNKNCILFQNQGKYHYSGNHIQGDKDPDCSPFQCAGKDATCSMSGECCSGICNAGNTCD